MHTHILKHDIDETLVNKFWSNFETHALNTLVIKNDFSHSTLTGRYFAFHGEEIHFKTFGRFFLLNASMQTIQVLFIGYYETFAIPF